MAPIFFLRLLFVIIIFSTGSAVAQSLADVLTSIQERLRAVEQGNQMEAYLPSLGGQAVTVPEQDLIEWAGLSGVMFPSDENLSTLGIAERVTLLNQAIGVFRHLSLSYVNLRPEDLESVAEIGAVRSYLKEDFPELGKADASNYYTLLHTLAQNVSRLRVLGWPFAGRLQTKYYNIDKWTSSARDADDNWVLTTNYSPQSQPCAGWKPTSLVGDGIASASEPASWKIATRSFGISASLGESVTIKSGYSKRIRDDGSHPEERLSVSKVTKFYSDAALFASVPGRTGDQVGGKVALLFHNDWSPAASGALVTPVTWGAARSGYQVLSSQDNATATNPLGSGPEITMNLAWFDIPTGDVNYTSSSALPAGFSDLVAGLQSGEWDALENLWRPSDENGITSVLSRTLLALYRPAFVKGLDAGTKATFLAKSAEFLRPPAGDALPLLHPVPGLLLGVPLGVGLEGESIGWLGISPGDTRFVYPNIGFGGHSPGMIELAWYYSPWLATRFDHAANLRFVGAAQDFHVVYETSRDPLLRGAVLPPLAPTWQEGLESGWTGQFFAAWDMPRIRQIVSRDLIVDVKAQGHYQNEVKIYRRPLDTSAVNRTPGHLEVPSQANLIRTLVFSNPDSGVNPYSAVPEKVRVTDGATLYEVSRDSIQGWGTNRTLRFSTTAGPHEYFSKSIEFPSYFKRVVTTAVDGVPLSVDEISFDSNDYGQWETQWWENYTPRSVIHRAAGQATTLTNTFDESAPGLQWGRFPKTALIDFPDQADISITWKPSGIIDLVSQGLWSSKTEANSNELTTQSKFGTAVIGTSWTDWSDDGRIVKTTSAPDGGVATKSAAQVAWSELEYGTTTGSGLPGLPHKLTRKDGSGATWQWVINTDGSTTSTVSGGELDNGAVVKGTKFVSTTNARGYLTATTDFLINGTEETQTAGTSTPSGQLNVWGAPLKAMDLTTGLTPSRTFDGNRERLSSATDALGLQNSFTGYDSLDRLTGYTWNGTTGSFTHNDSGFNISGTLAIPGRATSFSKSWDAAGLFTGVSVTAGGTSSLNVTRDADTETFASSDTATTASGTVVIRKADGSVATATGNTRPFGGTADPDGLSVDGGHLKSGNRLGDQSATFLTTWTDAWGRIRKTTTASGTTDLLYSDSSSSLKRVRVNEPTGRKTVTESDPYNAAGAITRSGIDVNSNGSLGASDRYVESVTSVSGGSLVTTLKLTEDTGLREILRTEWNPDGNVTVTTINGNEETITRTPNYTAKTITTTSSKGWSKSESFNNLGLTTNSVLSGPGVPSASLTPTWRADGSLEGVAFTASGDTHSATFNPNGTLATLTAPGKGNILGGHSISGGQETLTVDGITTVTKVDGTQSTTSGGDVPNKTETLATSGSGFKSTTTPAAGAATEVVLNAAGAPTAKNYAAGAGEARDYYTGGLLKEITLARGGKLAFGYSSDGAKDLTSATWPTVASGSFTIPAIVQNYGHDRTGRVDEIGDSSGAKSIIYQNGRHKQTVWNSGALAGYKVVRGLDTSGRETGFELWRGNVMIHAAQSVPNGVSGEISSVTASGFSAILGRTGARNLESITRGPVTQRWQRGTAGRILLADTNNTVNGAPSFNYKGTANDEGTAFDSKGRRLKCATAGGEWVYQYTNGRLTSAVHPTLGNFDYQFDGIGRRTDKGAANTTDLLNRTLAWTNSQNKTVKVSAHPAAQVWFNGTQVPNFTGSYNHPVPSPGPAGGWFAWNTLAVLPGQGDAGANPDAKAAQSGAVWVPPVNESFAFDAAGNRESSALWDFGWDAKNQFVRARTKNYNNSTTPQGYDITNAYDAESRRFSKKVNRYQNGQIVEQKVITFLHDGNDIVYEREQLPSGLTICERKYVWGPDISGTHGGVGGAGGLLLIRETKGNVTIDLYPLYDGSGNVVALADNTGTLQADYGYTPFGELLYARGPRAQSCPFRFATKYSDIETGLCNFGERFYDPVTCQWTSREPLGERESLNLYDYGHGDPINNVDVQGLEAVAIDASVNSGIPTMIYEEWAGSGLAYLWNAMAAGNVKTWNQAPAGGQLKRNFYFEGGQWHLRSARDKLADSFAEIPGKMDEIGPFLDAAPVVAVGAGLLPLVGTVEVGAGIYVYGSQALGNAWVQGSLALVGTQAAFDIVTDEDIRNDTIGAIASDPNGVRATGELLGVGVSGLARMGPRAATLWDTVADGLFPSYGGTRGFARGSVINPFPAKGGPYSVVRIEQTLAGIGGEVHHMPSQQALKANRLSPNSGSSIHMAIPDHRVTASHGFQGLAGAEFRAREAALIRDGRMDDAIQMGIDDLLDKFPNGEYDDHILEMINKLPR